MLPAYAGMIPLVWLLGNVYHGAPRVCGDDPLSGLAAIGKRACSPRMRG